MAGPKGKYHSNVSFLDLLFNLVVGFVMLFIIAFLLIRPIAENKQIEQKAEYVASCSIIPHVNAQEYGSGYIEYVVGIRIYI